MTGASFQFANPPLAALETNQRGFAMAGAAAMKYPRDVTPFAALKEDSLQAWEELLALMEPGETTWVICNKTPVITGLRCDPPMGVLQMTYPAAAEIPSAGEHPGVELERLSCANAEEMVALTTVAFPGFFRRRTCEMGSYFGIREAGRLVAMCGERMAIGEFRELSGLCTHPDFRGRGYAPLLMTQLMRDHRRAQLRSYLHVAANNAGAIALYVRMGFDLRGKLPFCRVTRI